VKSSIKELGMETIPLREAALRLAKIRQPGTTKIDDGQLLSLLRAGDLRAGFEFLGATRRWIPIDRNYWVTVDSAKFRSIRSDGGYTFKVRLRDFAEIYSGLVLNDSSSLKDELPIALAAASQSYEVVIQADEWKEYLSSHDLDNPPFDAPRAKGKGGRPALASWRPLCVIISAYLLEYHKTILQQPNHQTAADEIWRIAARKIDAVSLPARDTIEDVIGEIYRKTQDILKK
jgi:hypothetical protein